MTAPVILPSSVPRACSSPPVVARSTSSRLMWSPNTTTCTGRRGDLDPLGAWARRGRPRPRGPATRPARSATPRRAAAGPASRSTSTFPVATPLPSPSATSSGRSVSRTRCSNSARVDTGRPAPGRPSLRRASGRTAGRCMPPRGPCGANGVDQGDPSIAEDDAAGMDARQRQHARQLRTPAVPPRWIWAPPCPSRPGRARPRRARWRAAAVTARSRARLWPSVSKVPVRSTVPPAWRATCSCRKVDGVPSSAPRRGRRPELARDGERLAGGHSRSTRTGCREDPRRRASSDT